MLVFIVIGSNIMEFKITKSVCMFLQEGRECKYFCPNIKSPTCCLNCPLLLDDELCTNRCDSISLINLYDIEMCFLSCDREDCCLLCTTFRSCPDMCDYAKEAINDKKRR